MKKKLTKKLTLHRETLAELTDPRLGDAAGAKNGTGATKFCTETEQSCYQSCLIC